MEKEQLDKASKEAFDNFYARDPIMDDTFKSIFEQGAKWTMSLPLADRLTDEEKEMIRNYHRVLTRDKHVAICNRSYSGQAGADAMLFSLEQIFGEELFNEE